MCLKNSVKGVDSLFLILDATLLNGKYQKVKHQVIENSRIELQT